MNLTNEENEEKKQANKSFYNGDITQKYFNSSDEIQIFVLMRCRRDGFTPCAQNKKTI